MSTKGRDDARVDALRERLKGLGYLDAGVDRFVLGSARPAHSPARLALAASVRIGLLAAVLLGPAAAVGLVTRVPALVRGPRDAVVAAVYLGVLFGLAAAAVSFAAALLASWAAARAPDARFFARARRSSTIAGVAVTAGCLGYLTLWWHTAGAASAWASPWWTAFALGLAAAISLVLGHAVAVTAGAVTMALPERGTVPMGAPRRAWRRSLAASAAAFSGAAVLLLVTARDDAAAGVGAPLSVRPSGPPVTVIAIDGFDPALHRRAARTSGGAPGLLEAMAGAGADLAPADTSDPARLWTTIATGVNEETHGVVSLETRRIAGLRGRLASGSLGRVLGAATDALRLTTPAIASGFERRVRTFWEVAEAAGLRTAVVNWWATWPADPSGGRIISDRAILRLERGGPLDAELAPAELYESLRMEWSGLRAAARELAASHFSTHVPDGAVLTGAARDVLIRSAELDGTVVQLGRGANASGALDLLVLYLPGLDIAQHTLLVADAPRPPSELGLRISALERYYAFLDELLRSDFASGLGGERRVFIVAQPGRGQSGDGMLAAVGAGFSARRRASARTVDVAPTILHTLGVPVATDLDGDPIGELFPPELLAKYPVRSVGSYGRRDVVAAGRGGAPLDQETIDRLRSLGYVR